LSDRLTLRGTFAELWRTYRGWAPSLMLLALIVFVPVALLHSLAVNAEIGSIDFDGLAAVLGTAAALAVLAITALLGEVFYTGAVTATLTHAHDGHPPTLGEVARSVRYGRLIVVDLLYGVIVAVGTILLLAPGVAAFVLLGLAAPVVELEDRGATGAFRRSAALVRGRFWTVLAILVPLELLESGSYWLASELADGIVHGGFLSHWLAEVLASVAFSPVYAVAAVLVTVTLIHEKDGAGPRLHSAPVQT
jgi:hypothetical protein